MSLRGLLSKRSLMAGEALLPDVATGLRAATATVLPILLSIRRPLAASSWMALGGWLGTLADPGGSRLVRARSVLAFAGLGSAVVAIGEVGAPTTLRMTVLVGVTAFVGGVARALGASASSLGTLLTIVAAVAIGRPSPQPAGDVIGFLAGSALALVLSSIVWPVWNHLPVRRATAAVFSALAEYARAIDASIVDRAGTDDEAWTKLGTVHARRVRDAIEAARDASLAVRARHAGETHVGSNLRVLLGMAESQFLALVALASEVEVVGGDARASVRSDLHALAATYTEIGSRLLAPISRARDATGGGGDLTPSRETDALAAEMVQDARAALGVVASLDRAIPLLPPIGSRGADAAAEVNWTTLRDALAGESPTLHHAVRVALAAATSVVVGRLIAPRFAAWVTVTAVVVLQPDAGATVRRAAERVMGTVFGGLVAVALAALRLSPVSLAVLMFPLSAAALVTRPRSYRWFTFFLTPVFTLLAMHTPGDWWVAVERGVDTLAGGALALAASLLLWPRWEERSALPGAVAVMVETVQEYASLVVDTLESRDRRTLSAIGAARLRAAATVGRAETSLERVLENPLVSPDVAREAPIISYARRLVLGVSALDTLASRRARGRDVPLDATVQRVRRFEGLLVEAWKRLHEREDPRSRS